MKRNVRNLLIGLCLTGGLAGCDLDVIPPANIAAESFWKDDKDAWYALNACYSGMDAVDIWDEMCTDNAHSHKPWEGNYELVQQNGINASAGYGSYYFGMVRTVNNFLVNVENCNMDATLRERMKAEARFFRAMSYLDLTTKFGKVPIVTAVMDYDAPNVPRDEVEQVRAFILQELQEISEILPESYDGSSMNEVGRITRYGALALRARAALYFGNYAEAEKSAAAVMNSGKYSLFKISSLNDAQNKEAAEMDAYMDYEAKGLDREKFLLGMFSYESLWFEENASPANPEFVVTREYMADANNNDWCRYTYFIPKSLSVKDGYCSYEPMQDLIDAYWDADGKTLRNDITMEQRKANFEAMWKDFEEVRNDQAAYFAKVKSTDLMQYPYMEEFRNRDSRLYASMLFPFKGWHETAKGEFYLMFDPTKINQDGNETWTGYCFRKMVALEPYDEYNSPADYPVIRYAEVLLTFAEAHLQNSGWDAQVTGALNLLRDRCGMPDVPASLSKEEGINFIRNERRIELAAEGHRFDDIRRYGSDYCKQVMNGPSYAPNGYQVINKVWDDRLLLMPIPQSSIDLNPLLKDDQNPGY
ncbi:MAG: RagB/SusD family nutrient uptake outer membrane protein [Bacteroides sp.]|nr:RagB/SusD family nutrient uptake outer membrane protein [Bacteroides sp.]